jgi:EAL domain-containing protein (putative c-di-GMP-specific phosphodiesterase class I)
MRVGDRAVVGYEMLYRGNHPVAWRDVDVAIVSYLGAPRSLPPLYVNLSDEGLLVIPTEDFVQASSFNNVVFEMSESVAEYSRRRAVTAKVNSLIDAGVRVAIDDFGAGRDSLERIYSISAPAAIKIDGEFLQLCAVRKDAEMTLRHLVDQWRNAGIASVAEGVENPALYQFAIGIGCDRVQGWHVDYLVR